MTGGDIENVGFWVIVVLTTAVILSAWYLIVTQLLDRDDNDQDIQQQVRDRSRTSAVVNITDRRAS